MTLKVGMLTPFYPHPEEIKKAHVGGVERYVQSLSHSLSNLGIKITVITSFSKDCIEYDNDVKIVKVKRFFTLFRTPIFKWKKKINTDFNILHTHGTYPFLSDFSAGASKKIGIPSVLSYHFDGTLKGPLGLLFSKLYYATLAPLMKKHDIIIVTTKSYMEKSKFLKEIPKRKLRIVPCGVDTRKFRHDIEYSRVLERYNLEEGYVLFVGRLVPYKGLHYLLEAMKETDRMLVVVGKGPLEKMLKKYKNINLLGYVPEKNLPAIYRGAGVTVLPSISSQEAFGICLLESMACGTPVVATNIPGVKEVAKIGGLIAQKKDPISLASTIKRVLDNSHKYERKSLSEKIKSQFSWNSTAKKILSLYQSILEE